MSKREWSSSTRVHTPAAIQQPGVYEYSAFFSGRSMGILVLLFLVVLCEGKRYRHTITDDTIRTGYARTYSSGDPEVDALPEEIISRWGYPWKKYDVVTEDGYILDLYRIPASTRGAPVVFMQHGLEGSCVAWIGNLPNQSAAFIFSSAGFDVWLGNFRGNTYSRRHTTLSPKDHDFWKFSWDEMAHYDLPAMINKALNITKSPQLYYIGHSMGTLTAFARFSQDNELANKIVKFYALGPVYTVKDIRGAFHWLARFAHSLDIFLELFGVDEFLPHNWIMDKLAKYFCGKPISDRVCENVLFLFGGPNSHQMNITRLPVYLSHSPAGTSTRNMAHFGQMVKSGLCRMFDYGSVRENRLHYNRDTPPEYDVSGMKTSVALFYGAQDWLATPKDVQRLISKLSNLSSAKYLEDFNHLDFIWGLRAATEVYVPILRDIIGDIVE